MMLICMVKFHTSLPSNTSNQIESKTKTSKLPLTIVTSRPTLSIIAQRKRRGSVVANKRKDAESNIGENRTITAINLFVHAVLFPIPIRLNLCDSLTREIGLDRSESLCGKVRVVRIEELMQGH